ncbi:hypothetical protein K0U91_13425 [Chryseobacterium chendengshani]|uniref:hypothetical protein n=1 Tax=Chryseobacterium sp. LJ668 TaxID=2864040 RepID=UPI001C687CAA|nr:hypothetical protein [Chryseobacterium sp. LJ668]MBW8522504.1 hypothetical protein [Chryseobacterium sp. LJ668]QYK16044.1 hypothetical protein K0U91_13425 [Chryseobacterium sp. LJ668]
MIKRGYLLVCIVIFTFTHAQQKYYESMIAIDVAIKQNNYKEAYTILQGIKEPLSDLNKRTALDIYLKNDKKKPALKLIRELGEINYHVKYMLTKDSLILKAMTKERFYKAYNKGLKKFIVNYNQEFSDIITESQYLDQYVRTNESFTKLKRETDFLKETDLSNYKRISQQIDKYGFPTAKTIGQHNLNNLDLILMHCTRYDDSIYTKVVSYYEAAIKNKNLRPTDLGYLIDDHDAVIQEKATTFGLKTQTSKEGQKLYEEKKITIMDLIKDKKYIEFNP